MFDRRAPKVYRIGGELDSSQMFIVQAVRIGFLCAILIVTLISQSLQSRFINLWTILPIYGVLFFSFSINLGYVLNFKKCEKILWLPGLLFALELLSVSYLVFQSGVGQSIFLFMYLVNIILCGFIYQQKGSFLLASGSSLLFALVLVIGPQMSEQTLFYTWALNNTAFLSVAWLSGYLSEQLSSMGGELKEKGKNLSALKNINRLVVENIPSGLLTVDMDGQILQVNRAAHKILQVDHLGGKNLFDIFNGIRELLDGLLVSEASDKRETVRFDFNYLNEMGEKSILSFSGAYFENPERSMVGIILIFEDQTRLKHLEYAMRQSEKLAAVGQLAAGMAHEIRNPLASMSGSIQMLNMDAKSEDEKRLMGIVLKETDRLNNLITEFLDYARPDQPVNDPVELNSLMKEVWDLSCLNLKERSDIKIEMILDGEGEILSHRDKLKQGLLNIVMNACQAMREVKRPLLRIHTCNRGDKLQLSIKDNGCGMSDIMKKRMFEPFHTTKHGGTGLGLAVTHKILENHGAYVSVESAEGIGTEFLLEFPLYGSNVIALNPNLGK